MNLRAILSQNTALLKRLKARRPPRRKAMPPAPPEPIYADPAEYAREKLGVTLMGEQANHLRHLLIPPCIVNLPSGNNWGKTYEAAAAASWWYDSFPAGVVYVLAPRREHVVNVIFGQLRLLRAGVETKWIGSKAPGIYDGPSHFVVGMTASRGESFRGRHLGRRLFIFDEATAPEMARYLEELPTMFDPEQGDAVMFLYNPTDTTSRMYAEDQKGQLSDADALPWHRFRLNCLEHPNVKSQLSGGPILFKGAVNVAMIDEWVRKECEPVAPGDVRATDVEWRPGSGHWFRPGPWFQARCLGLWPDGGSGVWSDARWEACQSGAWELSASVPPEIGIDCATGKGGDYASVAQRWGKVLLGLTSSNTMEPASLYDKARRSCGRLADLYNSRLHVHAARLDPRHIPVKIDDDGVGCAVASFLRRDGYNVIPVGAATKAVRSDLYPIKRDELWFQVADKARDGEVRILPAGLVPGWGLDRETQRRLKQQLMAPEWWLVGKRRQVEPKDDTKEKIGRSPDLADAFNLAYYDAPADVARQVEPEGIRPREDSPYHDRGGRPR